MSLSQGPHIVSFVTMLAAAAAAAASVYIASLISCRRLHGRRIVQ